MVSKRTRGTDVCEQLELTSTLLPLALAALVHGVVPLSPGASVIVAHAGSLLTRFHVVCQ